MTDVKPMDTAQVVDLLRRFASGRSKDLDDLFHHLNPRFELDRDSEQIVFKTEPSTKTITLGNKGSCRLQAHAYAAAVFLTVRHTPGYPKLRPEERRQLYAPANPMLTWAVSRDLQQWLKQRVGPERDLDEIMVGGGAHLPNELLGSLPERQRVFGEGFFQLAIAFIILHELAHLDLKHIPCSGDVSMRQEKEADRYAARWLLECPGITHEDRLNCLFSMTVAMMWLTVFNVYLGPSQSQTHPESYDRLYDLLDEFVDDDCEDERFLIWDFTKWALLVHANNAGIEVEAVGLQESSKEQVKYLIDLIAKKQPW